MVAVRWLLAWLAAVVVTALTGSVIQSQFNLARIAALDGPVPMGTRLETVLFDLASFGPVWAVITGLGLLIALVLAGLVARRWPGWQHLWFPLAGFLAVLVALIVMQAMLPVTPVAAARTSFGMLAMSLPGALGGWLYGWFFHRSRFLHSDSRSG